MPLSHFYLIYSMIQQFLVYLKLLDIRWQKLFQKRRAPVAKAIYEEMGGSSPFYNKQKMQAKAIEEGLKTQKDSYKCFIVMRCWHPTDSVVKKVKEFNPDQIILLPLYPQYSAATSGSSIEEWFKICEENNVKINTKIICCYPTEDNFIQSYVKLIKEKIVLNNLSETKLYFSAHGLPEK